MKIKRRNLLMIFITGFLVISSFLFTQDMVLSQELDYDGLVKCDGVTDDSELQRQKVCDFAALINTINYIITWVIRLSALLFIVMLAYAGLLMMTSKPDNRSKAKKMLWAGVIGFVIMITAWILVRELLGFLVDEKFKTVVNTLIK